MASQINNLCNSSQIFFRNIKCLLAYIVIFLRSCTNTSFPKNNDVDLILANISKEKSITVRIDNLSKFLRKINSPQNTSDDKVIQYFILKMISHYIEEQDQAVLIAFDSIKIDAGFANFICSFYGKIKHTNGFYIRYVKTDAHYDSIKRCVGISFSKSEIN